MADELRILSAVPTGLLIDGTWRPASGDRTFGVEDPATQRELRTVADANADDALTALSAAAAAQGDWAATPPRSRAEILRAAFEAMSERTDDLALLMTLEHGKPLAESKAEVAYAAEFFRWFSEETSRVAGSFATSPSGRARLLTVKQTRRSLSADHAVELPARDGHAQDRPRDRGRLHHGDEARQADAAVHA